MWHPAVQGRSLTTTFWGVWPTLKQSQFIWLRPHSPAGRGRRARKISARCSRELFPRGRRVVIQVSLRSSPARERGARAPHSRAGLHTVPRIRILVEKQSLQRANNNNKIPSSSAGDERLRNVHSSHYHTLSNVWAPPSITHSWARDSRITDLNSASPDLNSAS